MLGPSAHTDTFTRDNLPAEAMQPDFLLDDLGQGFSLCWSCSHISSSV